MASAAPRMWRELHRNDKGPDVEAVQRCLWHQLGDASTNARNGTYGEQTARDVGRARHALGLPGGTETFGAAMLEAVWPHADARAVALYGRVPAGVASWVPHLKRSPLQVGMEGSDVEGLQRALWRLLGPDSRNARNGVYGRATKHDVAIAREVLDITDVVGGAQVGHVLWAALSRWLDDSAVGLVMNAPAPPPPQSELRDKIVAQAQWALDHHSLFRYTQIRPMPASLHGPAPVRIDCSAFAILCHRGAGARNPNRIDGEYDGYGNTDSIIRVCRWVSIPLPGDFAMYPGHMAVVKQPKGRDASIISDGHDPISEYASARYRSDFLGFVRSPHLDG